MTADRTPATDALHVVWNALLDIEWPMELINDDVGRLLAALLSAPESDRRLLAAALDPTLVVSPYTVVAKLGRSE